MSVETTGAYRVVRRATSRNTLPYWLVAWVGWNSALLHLLLLTDSSWRQARLENLDDAAMVIVNTAPLVVSFVTTVGALFALAHKRLANERSGDR